jgi:hypothetical protein
MILGFLANWLPSAVGNPWAKSRCAIGFFASQSLPEILALCLTEDAVPLLVDQSCNAYHFWRNVKLLVNGRKPYRDAPELPFTAEYVRARLVDDRLRDYYLSISYLRDLMRLHGNDCDPGQLFRGHRLELLEEGILMLGATDVRDEHEVLLVHPWWKSMLETIGLAVDKTVQR